MASAGLPPTAASPNGLPGGFRMRRRGDAEAQGLWVSLRLTSAHAERWLPAESS